jgi:hypothetical protein
MIVHFPIVLAVLLPMLAVAALLMIRRRGDARLWIMPFALSAVLAGSAFVAVRTGEAEEERVEEVVAENALHEHEEAAEQFLVVAALVAAIAALGLATGTVGTAARLVATAGSLMILLMAVRVGEAGGALVYQHNAGSAYVNQATADRGSGDAAASDAADSDAR